MMSGMTWNGPQPESEERWEQALRSLPELDPPADLADRVMAAVLGEELQEESEAAPVAGADRSANAWLKAALGLLLAAGGGWLIVAFLPLGARLHAFLARALPVALEWLAQRVVDGAAWVWDLLQTGAAVLEAALTALGVLVRGVAVAAGPWLVLMVGGALALQLVLLSLAGRRSPAP